MGRTHLVVVGVVVLTEGDSVCRDEEMLKFIGQKVTVQLKLDPETKLMAIASCNIHGVWAAEQTV